MTREEIIETVSMRDVLAKYGIKVNHSGMCCCPIHQERHPSMKVYADGYKCFACNSAGDIFKFVQEMESCDFPTAFKMLGGTYKRRTGTERRTFQMRLARRKKLEQQAAQSEKDFRKILIGSIDLCRFWIDNRDPFSDDWTYAQNTVQWLWHVFDTKYVEGEEVNEIDVLGKCKEIRQKFLTV